MVSELISIWDALNESERLLNGKKMLCGTDGVGHSVVQMRELLKKTKAYPFKNLKVKKNRYYIVSSDGSIDYTKDNGYTIEKLYTVVDAQ